MNDIIPDEEMFEPNKYFTVLKDSITEIEKDTITKNMQFVREEYAKAIDIGQKTLGDTIAAMHTTLEREIVLNGLGINRVIDRNLVVEYISKVTPANSVKVVELEHYPRNIPDINAMDIKRVVDMKIFDEIIVVYTDFTEQQVKTREHKEMVSRNRDPIAFGVFHNDSIDFIHDRLYVITDWVDEHCDLTFSTLVARMKFKGIPVNDDELVTVHNAKTLDAMIKKNIEKIQKNSEKQLSQINPKPMGIFSRIWKAVTG